MTTDQRLAEIREWHARVRNGNESNYRFGDSSYDIAIDYLFGEIDRLQSKSDQLRKALRELLDDLHIRAEIRGNIDSDGIVVLEASAGIVIAAHDALNSDGKEEG